jgi:hypothetical protein
MTASRDPERLIRTFLQEGDEQLHDQVYDAVRASIEHKRQRALIGPWRTPTMNRFLAIGAAAVAVLVVVVIGSQILRSPSNTGSDGTATPTPQLTPPSTSGAGVLASGTFTVSLDEFGEAVDIEAVRTGDVVSGTMEISQPAGGEGAYSVDLQCAQTTDKGFLMIGGEVTESTYTQFIDDGAFVVIGLAPGTPVRMLWAADVLATDEAPAPAESCAAFLEGLLDDPESIFDTVDVNGRPIQGDLELGE